MDHKFFSANGTPSSTQIALQTYNLLEHSFELGGAVRKKIIQIMN